VPADPAARDGAAAAAGLLRAELDRKLTGVLPRVLLPAVAGEQAGRLQQRLTDLGFGVIPCDPQAVPGDGERVIARKLAFEPGALVVSDGTGQMHRCPRAAIETVQRGTRVTRAGGKVTKEERRFSLGRTLLSQGLVTSKKVTRTTVTPDTSEAFLLVVRGDGEPDVICYERRIDYRALGPDMQASSRLNLEQVWKALGALAPGTADDRVARPGFVAGLPVTGADPVDLALYLVTLARRRGYRS
jgi:hypothetical protein